MLAALSRPFVRLVDRWLPDPYIFVLLLTAVVFIAAIAVEGTPPQELVVMWGDGVWNLLSFSMQMVMVLVAGFMMASTPPVKRALNAIASRASSPASAIVIVTAVSLLAAWLNWGFGLVVGALLAKAVARQVKVDYRLLVAAAYSGFVVWHGGLAGSIPLSIATEGHAFTDQIGVVPTSETVFASYNLILVIALFLLIPTVNRFMIPKEEDSVFVDPKLLEDKTPPAMPSNPLPADRLENSPVLSWIVGAMGAAYLVLHFVQGGGLTLNIVNFLFLTLAILLHGTPARLLASLQEGVGGAAGIIIQFPFYAGIMAMMVGSGLAASISGALVETATATTLPFWTFLSAGVVNFFVPSGGGQWAVQAPIVLPAAAELGADQARVAMAVAWGDAWTNLVQPFWALPVLGIAGLKARDIMGFCVIHLIITGVVIALGLMFL